MPTRYQKPPKPFNGNAFQAELVRMNITQNEFAKLCGISYRYLSGLLCGYQRMNARHYEVLTTTLARCLKAYNAVSAYVTENNIESTPVLTAESVNALNSIETP